MAITVDQFIYAIAGQESGGNYGAVNGRTGALGKYQILPSNIGPWSRQYLGYTVTPSQFLSNPELQERLARAVLSSYFNQYGARGAAAAWYSGSPSNANNYTRFRSNEPSIGEYVDQVLARAGGAPGGATTYSNYNNTKLPQIQSGPEVAPVEQPAATAMDGFTGNAALEMKGAGLDSPDPAGAANEQVGLDASNGTPASAQAQAPVSPADLMKQAEARTAGLPNEMRAAVLAEAKKYLGAPYVYGGSQPGGFDCSGLLQYAFAQVGLSLPRISYDQLRIGTPQQRSKLLPGDFVGFGDGGHIALYLGNNQILEAPRSGTNVRIRTLGDNENAFGVSLDNLYK